MLLLEEEVDKIISQLDSCSDIVDEPYRILSRLLEIVRQLAKIQDDKSMPRGY